MTVGPIHSVSLRGRILLVADTSVLREIHTLLLRTAGYDVVTCTAPAEALSACASERCHAAVIDCQLHHWRQVLNTVLECHPDMALVLLTGGASDSVRDSKHGAATLVVDWPQLPDVLTATIEEAMSLADRAEHHLPNTVGRGELTPASDTRQRSVARCAADDRVGIA